MKRWMKWIIIISVILVCSIFFGSMVFTMLGYLLDFMGMLMGWLASAVRWLANVFDVFGILGLFSANADMQVVAHNIEFATKLIVA